jgi:hypothetical protein
LNAVRSARARRDSLVHICHAAHRGAVGAAAGRESEYLRFTYG